jgi:alkylation response protein AidB-like acyl-CoA dehydrogenase
MKLPQRTRGLNFFEIDPDLHLVLESLQPAEFSRWRGVLSGFGAWVGGPLDEEAAYTDRFARPRLIPYEPMGALINHIQYNPSWENAAREIYKRGIVGLNYIEDRASYLITFAMGYLTSQSDVSLHCPATMTGAVAHILNRFAPEAVRTAYLPQLVRMDGDALSAGTWATELHGGSDIGATTTVARRNGNHYLLTGLKWFASNVDGGIAIATARPENASGGSKGLGLYLVPGLLPDGALNPMRIRRLKDKLGTCGIATGEVDLTDSYAIEVAGPPDGFKLMMEALEFSRIHNALSGVGVQRRAFLEALCFAANRNAFGDVIISYPMIQNELVMMRVALEADLALAFEAAFAFDQAWRVPLDIPVAERTWLRLCTALAKYQTAETANRSCRAAIELIGGNGYTYDYVTPRLLRDAQVLSVWEGPANVQALEVLRLLKERYAGFDLFRTRVSEIAEAASAELSELAIILRDALADCAKAADFVTESTSEGTRHARRLMGYMAQVLAAALLVEQAVRELQVGNDRKALVARAYIEQHLAPWPRRGIGETSNWIYKEFGRFIEQDVKALSRG